MIKVVIIGATGRTGERVGTTLRAQGHVVEAPAHDIGGGAVADEALDELLSGADAVLDLTEPWARTRGVTERLIEAERRAGARRHVLLSLVGANTVSGGFFGRLAADEALLEAGGVPFTIARTAPLFEDLEAMVNGAAVPRGIALPPLLMQPIAADDLADILTNISTQSSPPPLIEAGGPETWLLPDLAEEILGADEDDRRIITDPAVPFFGAIVGDRGLVAYENPRVGPTAFEDWLRQAWFHHKPPAGAARRRLAIRSAKRGSNNMTDHIHPEVPPSGTGCVECLADGGWWFHLRRCAECGHVGCCDSSPSQHARAHFHGAGHPIIQSFEPGEDWFFDYRTRELRDGPVLAAPNSRPVSQPAPGPAGAVPSDWTRHLRRQTRPKVRQPA